MRTIKTLVVDDEPFARTRIVKLLGNFDYISVIGISKNGREAVTQIQNYKPDLVFLDIQMPDLSGFDVLSRIEKEKLPFIIFVTAFDQYALQAFDIQVVDYLLKPYDDERFTQALEYAKQQIMFRDKGLLHEKMINLIKTHNHISNNKFLIEIKNKGRCLSINIHDIYYIKAYGNYVKLNLEKKTYLLRKTLYSIKTSLDQHVFLQIHRSTLINCNYIKNIRYLGNNQYRVHLKNNINFQSSRSYKENIHQYMMSKEEMT